jgi:hypothetical protein
MPLILMDDNEVRWQRDNVSDGLISKLADLLVVPEEKREEFLNQIAAIKETFVPPDGSALSSARKGNAAFVKAGYHIRGLLDALGAVNDADVLLLKYVYAMRLPGLLRFETWGIPVDDDDVIWHEKKHRPASFDDTLPPLAAALAYLVGRNHAEPKAKDWRLNEILRDIRTWPEHFGARGITDHRSKTLARAIDCLHEIIPDVVPAKVSPETIKSIWHPREKKGRKRIRPALLYRLRCGSATAMSARR